MNLEMEISVLQHDDQSRRFDSILGFIRWATVHSKKEEGATTQRRLSVNHV
jgi:hypothetical protein